MQSFTGTGFSNEEIKKEDIAKQIKSVNDAISSLRDMHISLLETSSASFEQGAFLVSDENRSKKAEQEAKKFKAEFVQLKEQMQEYLEAMPHD